MRSERGGHASIVGIHEVVHRRHLATWPSTGHGRGPAATVAASAGDRRAMDRPPASPPRDPALADELARLAAAAGAAARGGVVGRRRAAALGLGARWCWSAPTWPPSWSSWRRRAGPGVHVCAWSPAPTGSLPRRAAGRRRAGGRAAGRGRAGGRAAHRPGRGRPPRGRRLVGVRRRLGRRRRHDVRVRARPGRRGRRADRCVVDLDPLGAGCDRVLGLDDASGVRWDSLGTAVGAAERPVAARGGPAPRRARRAGLAARASGAARRPARCARPCPPRAAATTSSWSTCPAPRDPLVAETAARCDLVVRGRAPTVTGVAAAARWVGRAARPRPARPGGARHGADPRRRGRAGRRYRSSPRWPTSAGWPSRSTSGWARCARGAVRWPRAAREVLGRLAPSAVAA